MNLCIECGLCCNGVMFSIVALQPGESAKALGALGLRVKRGTFTQPCAALDGLCCTIYEQRPVRCRLFECQQLQRIADGRLTEAQALEAIRDVQRRVAELNLLLEKAGANNPRKPLYHRCVTALGEDHPPELLGQIARASAAIEAILDADFRLPRTESPAH